MLYLSRPETYILAPGMPGFRRRVMPIYLDRHDFAEKFTREEILEKHRRDVEVGQKYGVRFVAYWCDVTEGVAFCLMDAPSAELAAAVHRESHGAVANRIIQVDPDQ